jgi:copper(I)-binding protein/putative intracellular protease/amidase
MIILPMIFVAFDQISSASQTAAKKEYVCPPCGCSRDDRVSEEAGNCLACGMELIEKGSAAAAAQPQQPQVQLKKAAILIFEGVQIIDYTGPYEVFGQAGFNVYTVAVNSNPLRTAMGMNVTPHFSLANAPKPDVIIIPGGGVQNTQENPEVIKWIQDNAKEAQHVLSVCNGAFILAKTGLLDGLSATTYYRFLDSLAEFSPKTKVVNDQRYVDNGKFITTAGLSSGIDGSLYVVSKMMGKARAQGVALNMEYNWQPNSGYARASFADMSLFRFFQSNMAFAVPDGINVTLLSTEGGRDAWEINWLVTGNISASDAAGHLNTKLETQGKWKRINAKSNDSAKSEWSFEDNRGGVFKGEVTARPESGESNRLRLVLKINRTGSVAPSKPISQSTSEEIIIKDAWIQEMPPSRNLTAAYMVIENRSAQPVSLVSAGTDAAGAVELHMMETQNNMMRMRKLDRIDVPAAGRTELNGNLHIMLLDLKRPLQQGDNVEMTFVFDNSTRRTLAVPVRKRESVRR